MGDEGVSSRGQSVRQRHNEKTIHKAQNLSLSLFLSLVESAKGVLLKFLPDVYLHTDHLTGAKAGKSPGFGLVLTAETTTGAFLSAEAASRSKDEMEGEEGEGKKEPTVPEELGEAAANALLEEIYR